MLTRTVPTLFNREDDRQLRFSELMDRFFDNVTGINRSSFAPKMDVAETDKAFEISVILPGVDKNNIDVHFENNMLTVSGERRWEHEENNGRQFHRVETGYGSFSRTLPLPDYVDGERIDATYRNGELFITVPKLKEKAGKRIKVS